MAVIDNLTARVSRASDGKGSQRLLTSPNCPTQITEAYNALLTNLDLALGPNAAGAVAVAAVDGTADAALVATNLAVLTARSGDRTLVVDCDLQRPHCRNCSALTRHRALRSCSMANTPNCSPWRSRHLCHCSGPSRLALSARLTRNWLVWVTSRRRCCGCATWPTGSSSSLHRCWRASTCCASLHMSTASSWWSLPGARNDRRRRKRERF